MRVEAFEYSRFWGLKCGHGHYAKGCPARKRGVTRMYLDNVEKTQEL